MVPPNCRRLSPCLLIIICAAVSVFAGDDVFLSIDCGGASESYRDDNLINWTGDGAYVTGGEARTVSSGRSISHVIDTLRVFTAGRKKNCYSVDSIRRGRVLVRAGFYYGNYDGRSRPPAFDLLLDGNAWARVETSTTDYYYHEAIYVMKSDMVNVCIAQTDEGQFPFMSTLEVRGLDAYMYRKVNDTNPLFLVRRLAYGVNTTIRYPNDPYDRLWAPSTSGAGQTTLSSGVFFDSIFGIGDNPPPAVLKNAITPLNLNTSIQLNLPFPPVETRVYLLLYFSEVSRLGPADERSFSIFMNNRPLSNPFQPLYANVTELSGGNLFASTNTTVSLEPSNTTTLPPLINALELYLVGPELTNGTNMKDVDGLASLQNTSGVLQGWKGDPCLPSPYSWDWINCSSSSSSTPRVTALFLGSFGLAGHLPDFSSMDALETIDLHNNSLNGSIPDFLSTFPNLKELNLASNRFTGQIPASLLQKTGLNLVVTDNPDLCTPGQQCAASGVPNSSSDNEMKISKILLAMVLGITVHLLSKLVP